MCVSREIEVWKCECCGENDVQLQRTYFGYPIKCSSYYLNRFIMVRHCNKCIPEKPAEPRENIPIIW